MNRVKALLTRHLEGAKSNPCGTADAPAERAQLASRRRKTSTDRYLYATAAADGPAKGMRSKRLNPTCRHHSRKSAPV